MKWVKKGFICSHETFDLDWYKKNTMVPLPYLLNETTIRIFITMCDEKNIGRIGYVDVDADNPSHIKGYSKKADTVRITVNGKVFCEKPLSIDCEIDINGTNTAVIEKGSVYMKSATCPDKLCIHQGKAHDGSKKIICLPNKVVIEVIKKSEIDTVVN